MVLSGKLMTLAKRQNEAPARPRRFAEPSMQGNWWLSG